MAWEWSHTAEGIENVRLNLMELDRETLEVIWSEWKAWDGNTSSTSGFDEAKYKSAIQEAKALTEDILADSIWEQVESLATCENGGYGAWLCPFGCHTASFDHQE